MRKMYLLLLGLIIGFQVVQAQQVDVSGRVTDDKGSPIAGASVKEKGTTNGTTTDGKGNFSLSVKRNATVEISGIGFETKSFEAKGGGTFNVELASSNQSLTEVVVTASGIKREKKALGYAVSTVGKKDLELRPDGDVVRVLNGKAPGVDISGASGLSGSGTRIIIRGVSTITGNATPLFVVDGVPFDASTTAQASFEFGNQTSSRFLDLDPNNIESIDVLKGLSATTRYGELGRNGVVLITTKSGAGGRKANKKLEVSLSQSLFVNQVANLPEYNRSYGAGFDLDLGLNFFSNWGARFTDPPASFPHPYTRNAPVYNGFFNDFIGKTYDYKYYNSVPDFFRTGIISTTSVNAAGGGPDGNFNVSYTYMDDKGFTPGNNLFKNNLSLGGSTKLANGLTVGATVNYTTTDFRTPPVATSFGSNPSASSVFGNLIYTPTSVDLMGLPYENPINKSSVYYRTSNDIQNPRWTVKNGFSGQVINRIFGQANAQYAVTKDLNISYRYGFDQYSDYNFLSQNRGGTVGGTQYQLGMHRTVNGYNNITNHEFFATWKKDLSNDWRLNVDGGFQSFKRTYEQTGMKSTQQLVYGLFNHNNFLIQERLSEGGNAMDFQQATQSLGVYGFANFAYKEFLYITGGGRNSWSSNLEKANRSLFYPNVSMSFIPTAAFQSLANNKNINYLKVRAGYSTSANFGDPYGTRAVLTLGPRVFEDRAGTAISTNFISNRLPNPDLRPELQKEFEIGFESKLLNNRLNIDFTFYRRVAEDQILERDLDPSTGFTVQRINAGAVRNQGVEIAAGYTVIRGKDWRWQVDANFTKYTSLVYDLPADITQISVAGFTNEGAFAINNQPLGILQGLYTVKESKTGERLVNAQGDYIASTEIGILGNPIPDFKLTGISTLTWKAFSFRMQWDYTKGGDMIAYTPGTLLGRGVTKDTEFDRALPIILPGVDANGDPNNIQVSSSQAYFNNLSGFFGMTDLITYDATVIRLREASLSYAIPASALSKTPFGSASIVFSGQNLWYNAPGFPKYTNFDPEISSLGAGNFNGYETLAGPTSRRMGVSLRVTF
jgi:TonB-linked SusC/RagA family outer membrane protein